MEKLRVFSTRREHETNEAYLADAIAALFGSILGVSTVATFAESTAGVADGAKTGGFRRCGVPVDGEEKSWNKIHHSRYVNQFVLGKLQNSLEPKLQKC